MFDAGVPKEWQAPGAETSEKYRLGWLRETVEQGAAWTESQRGFRDWRKSLDVLSGLDTENTLLSYRSHLSGHRLKTNVRTMISGLANIRPLWGYNAGEAFKDYALAMNKTVWALYLEGYWDQAIKEVLAYAAATGTGWIRPVWRRDLQGHGTIELLTYGQPCVLPVQLPADGDYQRAYSVTLLDETPIYEGHWRFPLYQDRIRPDQCKYWYAAEARKAGEQNAWKRVTSWFRRKQEDRLSDQYVQMRWTTINDCSINTSGHRMAMGEPGASWYYEVPSYGEEIPGTDGKPRKANELDARIYPQRRLIISTEDCIPYDGPAFNWHGKLDLIPFSLDKWPWEPMGFSLIGDGWELQKSIDEIGRGCVNKVRAIQGLPLKYNINGVNPKEAEDFDPFQPNTRIGYDGDAVDNPLEPAVPAEVYRIHAEELEVLKYLTEELDYLFQTRDILELGKARALGKGMDQLEALISAQGPIVKDISRSMEEGLGQVGSQVGWLVLQYMDTSRLMQYLGPDGLSLQVFDYNPSSIIPSHLPSEVIHGENEEVKPSMYTQMQRSKWFMGQVRCWITPHSAHEYTQMTHRLLLLQLRQRGIQISGATIMESCDIPNVEKPEGNTEQARFRAEKEEEVIFAARMQKIIQTLGIEQGLMGGAPGSKQSGSTSKGGRPPSGQAAPQMAQKDGGTRTIVKES
jgi:hypothetical protein